METVDVVSEYLVDKHRELLGELRAWLSRVTRDEDLLHLLFVIEDVRNYLQQGIDALYETDDPDASEYLSALLWCKGDYIGIENMVTTLLEQQAWD